MQRRKWRRRAPCRTPLIPAPKQSQRPARRTRGPPRKRGGEIDSPPQAPSVHKRAAAASALAPAAARKKPGAAGAVAVEAARSLREEPTRAEAPAGRRVT